MLGTTARSPTLSNAQLANNCAAQGSGRGWEGVET